MCVHLIHKKTNFMNLIFTIVLSFFSSIITINSYLYGEILNKNREIDVFSKNKAHVPFVKYENMLVLIPKTEEMLEVSPILKHDFIAFKEALGYRESLNKYDRVNDFGYFGKYQFGELAMIELGITDPYKFIDSPKIQEKAFVYLCSINKYKLRRYLYRYDNKVLGGIKLTQSGMLAAAHLLGPGAVIKFIKSDGTDIHSDALGTKITEYLTMFSDYDMSIITPCPEVKMKI